MALIAPSGAGKSTLLHIAGLLERQDAGEVFINDTATSALSDAARTRLRRIEIGFVYQFHHLLPEFSALENVMLPQMVRGLKKGDAERTAIRRSEIGFVYQFHHLLPEFSAVENVMLPQMIRGLAGREAFRRAVELLSYLGLKERLDHRPAELSGGEQQRVAIARAVANAPRVLLADEPTGNLDPRTADHVFGALSELVRASGLAALIATHNMDLAQKMDRRVTIRDGLVVELG